MKPLQFVVFFSIVIGVYSAINYYIYSRAIHSIPDGHVLKNWFIWIYLFLASSYIIARFLERAWLSVVSDIFTWVGSFWLGIMVYLLLAVILIDLLRLVNFFLPIFPEFLTRDPVTTRFWVFKVVIAVTVIIVLAGFFNALNPRLRRLVIHIPKKAGELKEVKLVIASDLHMGTLVGPRRTAGLVNRINALEPDLILFTGDLVDEDLAPVIRFDLGRSLTRLKAPLGVYAITGNHEYIGGAEKAVKYLREHGINILRDSVVMIHNSFYLAGREDREKGRFSGKDRMNLAELLRDIDSAKPIIMMDHQPFRLQEVADAGVDLQLSGHTHHGQLWPFNLITNAIYEISWGYEKIGNSHFYVSSGYGGWGPPVRVGNRPEIVEIKLVFD